MSIYLILACVGLLEAFLSTINSKFRQKSSLLLTFITSFINALVWYYLISMVVENIKNGSLILIYSMCYASGDVLGLVFDKYLEKLAKIRGFKFKKKIQRKKK
jgi:uncharacterized membrane protein